MLPNIAFTFITLLTSSCTLLIAITLFIILVIQLRQKHDVSLLLATNTYAAILVFSIVLLSATINVLKADLYGMPNLTERQLTGCRFQGFLTYEAFACCYMSLVLQGLYRLARVVYYKHKFLQSFSFNLCCIVLQWIIYFVILLPSYFWPGPLYSLYDSAYYCGIRYEKLPGLSYTIMNIYVLPIVYLIIIYGRLFHFIHNHAPPLSRARHRRKIKRDLIVTRRMLITVVALTIPGLPNVGFTIMVNMDHRFSGSYNMYRIEWMGPAITVFIISIVFVFINPHMKKMLIKLGVRRNQVAPTVTTMRELHPSSVLRTQTRA